MKRCPLCNRTYADETMSFCLADGSLLSAPYDPLREDAPPTEILPSAARPAVPPTQPPKAAIPTITSFPGYHGSEGREDSVVRPLRKPSPMLWIGGALAAVAFVVGLFFAVRYGFDGRNESANASNQQGMLIEVNSSSPSASPNISASPNPNPTGDPTSTVPAARSTPQDSKKAATLDADPALFPPDSRQLQYATPTASPAVDYGKIFSRKEVDTTARILDKPQPNYTEEARKNQINGTVVLRVLLAGSGEVTNIQVVSGLPDGLSERAIAAARRIKFVPAMKDGRAVSMTFQLEYNFNLY